MPELQKNIIMQGDSLQVLKQMPSDSIDCVITSPPYWALRDYGSSTETIWDAQDGCEHEWGEKIKFVGQKAGNKIPMGLEQNKPDDFNIQTIRNKTGSGTFCSKCGAWKGQLGLEPTFELYIKHLCDIFDEVKRVLKKEGTCWVNLGDTYSGGGNTNDRFQKQGKSKSVGNYKFNYKLNWIKEKCLCLVPFRFAIEMCNRGWILRNEIIWHKPSCVPSSAKDRFTVDFEYVFFFVKNKKYWFETQYVPLLPESIERTKKDIELYKMRGGDLGRKDSNRMLKGTGSGINTGKYHEKMLENFLKYGRNKRCVWSISVSPFSEAHFATFPEALCETPIKAGCPQFVCKKCGKAREKIYEYKGGTIGKSWHNHTKDKEMGMNQSLGGLDSQGEEPYQRIDNGYTDCGCDHSDGWDKGIVLDIFCGSGTALLVAKNLGRDYIGIELNPEYVQMAEERIKGFTRETWKMKKVCKPLTAFFKDNSPQS